MEYHLGIPSESGQYELNALEDKQEYLKKKLPIVISTGRWGCGAFGGDILHKFLQQVVAAMLVDEYLAKKLGMSESRTPFLQLQFSSFGDRRTLQQLQEVLDALDHCAKMTAKHAGAGATDTTEEEPACGMAVSSFNPSAQACGTLKDAPGFAPKPITALVLFTEVLMNGKRIQRLFKNADDDGVDIDDDDDNTSSSEEEEARFSGGNQKLISTIYEVACVDDPKKSIAFTMVDLFRGWMGQGYGKRKHDGGTGKERRKSRES